MASRQQLVGGGPASDAQLRLPATGSAGAAGPAASPGVQNQGSITGVQTTKVNIELHMAFSLDPDDFDLLDVPWKGAPYNVREQLTELYPSKKSMTWRLGRGGHEVVGAVLTIDGRNTADQPKPTDAGGKTTLKLFVPDNGTRFITIRVEPPDGQKNETGLPAGPGLTNKDTKNKFLFRPFTLMLAVDDTGALNEPLCGVFPQNPARSLAEKSPAYVRLIEVTKRQKSGESLVIVDWRPDWMLSGSEKQTKPRVFDTRDTPINPFDTTHAEEDRLRRAPPGVVIHQTGTHHLSFLPGFIANPRTVTTNGKSATENEESIHYVVDYDGFVIKVLDEFYRANHAGGSAWEQRVAANQWTVGIETMHTDTTPFAPASGESFKHTLRRFPKEQYSAIIRLLTEIKAKFAVRKRRLAGHMEVLVIGAEQKGGSFREEQGLPANLTTGTLSRDRAACPGPYFEWQRLEEAGVSLGRAALPSQSSDPNLSATFAQLATLSSVSLIKAGSQSSEAKLVKQLLFDIGYSVIEKPPPFTSRDQLVQICAAISDTYDVPAQEAVRAFQTHHFSGRRIAYTLFGKAPTDGSAPMVGTLDQRTILAIEEVWFAAMTSPD